MRPWEKTLDDLHRQGWSYGYAGFIDPETRKHFWLADASKGSIRVHVIGETMQQALADLKDHEGSMP